MKRSAAEEASRGMGEGRWERITGTKQKCVMEGDLVLQGLWGASGGCFSGAALWRRLNKWGVLHGPLERAREAGHRERQRRESQHPRRWAGACEGSAPPERSRPPRRPAIVGGTRALLSAQGISAVSKLAEGLAGVPEQLRREDRKGAEVAVKAQTALSSDPAAAICPDVSRVGDLSPYLEAKGQRREGGWAA